MPQGSGVKAQPPLVIRPSQSAGPLSELALAMLGGSVILAFMAYQQGMPLYAYVAGVLVVGSLAIGGYGWLYARNARMFVTEDEFGNSDWLGRRRQWPRSVIARIVQGPVSIGGAETIAESNTVTISQEILILKADETTLVSLSPGAWSESDLTDLWRRLGTEPTVGWTEPLRPEKLRKRFKGAASELPRSSLPIIQYAVVIAASLVLAIVLSICLLR